MDAISFLKRDHEEARSLFRELERTAKGAYARRLRIGENILALLEAHARVEEETFYPAVRVRADRERRRRLVEFVEEHRVMRDLIEELSNLVPEARAYGTRFLLLREHFEHHVAREEETLIEICRLLGDEVEKLGERMCERRRELTAASRSCSGDSGSGARRRPRALQSSKPAFHGSPTSRPAKRSRTKPRSVKSASDPDGF